VKQAPLVITISLARPAEEEKLFRSLSLLAKKTAHLIIADGGSSPGFIEEIRSLENTQVSLPLPRQERGLVSQIKVAFNAIPKSYRGSVLYTEPDKEDFIREHFDNFATQADGVEGLVLAARTPAAFATFPDGKRTTEGLMNTLCSNRFGVGGDFCYGPLVMDADFIKYAPLLETPFGWGWRFFMMALAHRLRRPIKLVEGDFNCPMDQRNEDDARARHYRMTQLGQNAVGLAAACLCDLGER